MTYGVELEYGDWDRRKSAPDGSKWNDADNTCVNSNGIANDPLAKLYQFGGEINTRPTGSINEQVFHIYNIIEALNPAVNYRCNLHIHIGCPELAGNLEKCKQLLSYFQRNSSNIFNIVEKLPELKETDHERRKWELKRLNRVKVSHQYVLPAQRYEAIMNSTTLNDFLQEHAPLTDKGRMWYFSPRPAMNMRQLWETGTVEFRHFPGTLNPDEIGDCLLWCQEVVNRMPEPDELSRQFNFKFPVFSPYNFEQEQCYQYTNLANNTRGEVEHRLKAIREQVNIDDPKTNLKEVYECIVYLSGKYKSQPSSGDDLQTVDNIFGL